MVKHHYFVLIGWNCEGLKAKKKRMKSSGKSLKGKKNTLFVGVRWIVMETLKQNSLLLKKKQSKSIIKLLLINLKRDIKRISNIRTKTLFMYSMTQSKDYLNGFVIMI